MMSQQFYHYGDQLQSYLQYLEKRIVSLEKAVTELTKEVAELKNRPSVRVDRIEYSFDQLKVETLDGTLNIGLNPADLQKIEELAINPGNSVQPGGPFYPPQIDPKQMMTRSMELEETLLTYIQMELPEVIMRKQAELGMEEDEAYIAFIQEDVTKQLPTRIQFYLQQRTASGNEEDTNQQNEAVIAALKQEIENGVQIFLSNIPDNVKGRTKE